MARAKSSEQPKSRAKATAVDDINRGIDRLKDLMAQVEDLTREGHPYREAVLARTDLSIRESIRRIFGEKSPEYQTHKVHKLRTNSRVESAQTTTVLKKLVAQLENQKRELLGLNPVPLQPDPSTSPPSEKAAPKTVSPSQNAAHITITPLGPSTPATAPVTLSVSMTTNLAAPTVLPSRLSSPAGNNGQQPSAVPEALTSPVANPPQSAGESGLSPSTAKADTSLHTKTATQPDTLASGPSSPSITSLEDPTPSSTDELMAVSQPGPLPSHPVPQSDNSADVPHSSPRHTSATPQQITSPPMNSAIVQPLESVKAQAPHIALETENIMHTPAPQHQSAPSPISAGAVVSSTNQDANTSHAPVQVVGSLSLDHGAGTSKDLLPVPPVLSSQPLSSAADAYPPISSGSSAGDTLMRSDEPTNPVRTMELRSDDPLQVVRRICSRFHLVTRQLRARREDRPSLEVEDEYDVQDLMHALLRLEFDEVQPEEWTPSYATGKTQTSYLLHREKAVIVVKKTKAGVTSRDLSEQVKVDSATYSSRTDYQTLFCFIYDPEGRIANPRRLEAELTMVSDRYTVEVIIAPK